MAVDYLSLISKYTEGEHAQTVPAFIIHSALVTKKALDIAHSYQEQHPEVTIDFQLLEEMGMLHDIGIFRTELPELFTKGEGPYIKHIIHGKNILEEEGLHTHAAGAKTHTDLEQEDIKRSDLPLPPDTYTPSTTEEEILSLADKFYTKRFAELFKERTPEEITKRLAKHGPRAVERFTTLYQKYCA